MLRRTYSDQVCSIARALEIVGERWTLLILRDAHFGISRFSQFRASLGIAPNILSARLEVLCRRGILERRIYSHHPERSDYLLTDKGREIVPVLTMLMMWGDRHQPLPEGPTRQATHRGCGGRAGWNLRCERCHEPIDLSAIEIAPDGLDRSPVAT
jgi:DNA-binding HxlR family transcriptional regulator